MYRKNTRGRFFLCSGGGSKSLELNTQREQEYQYKSVRFRHCNQMHVIYDDVSKKTDIRPCKDPTKHINNQIV